MRMTAWRNVARATLIFILHAPLYATAQWRTLPVLDGPIYIAGAPQEEAKPSVDERGLRNALLIAGGAALVGLYGAQKWWQDGFTGHFRTEKEGWFSQGTKYGGADKLGHAFFAYAGARLLTRGFESIGNPKPQASRLGFWSSLGVMMGIEVLDGLSKKYRFSPEDAAMNLLGAGLGYAMEAHEEWDRLLDFRLQYTPSAGSSFDPGGDYSGQIYLLAVKANALPRVSHHGLLRYVELAVGYGTREFDETPPGHPARHLYVGLSLNLSELLNRSLYANGTRYRGAQRLSDLFLEFVQVPGTALLYRSRL